MTREWWLSKEVPWFSASRLRTTAAAPSTSSCPMTRRSGPSSARIYWAASSSLQADAFMGEPAPPGLRGSGPGAPGAPASRAEHREVARDGLGDDEDDPPPASGPRPFPSGERKPHRLVAIPYYAWAHRGPGEMAVWIHRKK